MDNQALRQGRGGILEEFIDAAANGSLEAVDRILTSCEGGDPAAACALLAAEGGIHKGDKNVWGDPIRSALGSHASLRAAAESGHVPVSMRLLSALDDVAGDCPQAKPDFLARGTLCLMFRDASERGQSALMGRLYDMACGIAATPQLRSNSNHTVSEIIDYFNQRPYARISKWDGVDLPPGDVRTSGVEGALLRFGDNGLFSTNDDFFQRTPLNTAILNGQPESVAFILGMAGEDENLQKILRVQADEVLYSYQFSSFLDLRDRGDDVFRGKSLDERDEAYKARILEGIEDKTTVYEGSFKDFSERLLDFVRLRQEEVARNAQKKRYQRHKEAEVPFRLSYPL